MDWQRAIGIAAGLCLLALTVGCVAHGQMPTYEGSRFQVIVAAETNLGGKLTSMTEKEVQAEVDRLLALRPSADGPAKLLLFEVASSGPSKITNARKKLLLHKQSSETMKDALEKTGIFEQVDFLPDIYLPPGDPGGLKTLRIAAARAHADTLLMYAGEAGYEYRPNLLSVLYVTVVGAFIAPGSKASSMAVSKAVLVDVRSGYIYEVMETYGEKTVVTPIACLDEEQLEFDARSQSVDELSKLVAAKANKLAAGKN